MVKTVLLLLQYPHAHVQIFLLDTNQMARVKFIAYSTVPYIMHKMSMDGLSKAKRKGTYVI